MSPDTITEEVYKALYAFEFITGAKPNYIILGNKEFRAMLAYIRNEPCFREELYLKNDPEFLGVKVLRKNCVSELKII